MRLPKEFWDKVKKPNDCWLWLGDINTFGYGMFGKRYAHRLSFEEFHGEIKSKNDINHICRNRICVNPKHLEQISHRNNVRLAKGLEPVDESPYEEVEIPKTKLDYCVRALELEFFRPVFNKNDGILLLHAKNLTNEQYLRKYGRIAIKRLIMIAAFENYKLFKEWPRDIFKIEDWNEYIDRSPFKRKYFWLLTMKLKEYKIPLWRFLQYYGFS